MKDARPAGFRVEAKMSALLQIGTMTITRSRVPRVLPSSGVALLAILLLSVGASAAAMSLQLLQNAGANESLTTIRSGAPRTLAADSLMGPGVSQALARRRAREVADVRYHLALDVTSPDSARGTVQVRWTRSGTGDAILDFRGRRLNSIVANGAPVNPTSYNGAHLRIPAALLKASENEVTVTFVSEIAASGASIIKSHDPDGSDYLYTLLVPADANQLFPSFDQPDLKARVTLQLTAPVQWTVIANGALATADTSGRQVTHTFNETRPISTYLVAFAAGPWAKATSTVGTRTINVYVRQSRMKEADVDTMLALNQRAITWMEEYFNRPYPFEKFDFVLAPAFPFGGMEHPGAVFYNENSFIFRERPTLARRLSRFSTILHEVAHQWFGDLVTMRWFDDLWLKEGFATYMAAKAQFAMDTSSGAWKTFYQSNKPSAYNVDLTTGTTSLWQPLANLDQAKSNYGAIVYNKAPSVLKQLNYLVGEDTFQRGVRQHHAHVHGAVRCHLLAHAVPANGARVQPTESGSSAVADVGDDDGLRSDVGAFRGTDRHQDRGRRGPVDHRVVIVVAAPVLGHQRHGRGHRSDDGAGFGDGERDGTGDRVDHGIATTGQSRCGVGGQRHHPPGRRCNRSGVVGQSAVVALPHPRQPGSCGNVVAGRIARQDHR